MRLSRARTAFPRGTAIAPFECMETRRPTNPWKTAVIGTAIGVAAFGLLGLAFAGGSRMFGNDEPGSTEPEVHSRVSPAVVENCNVFAAQARDNARIAKNGVVGGAVGAGVGAASGAIADGGKGAGKGAGIGALVGAAAGAFYGLTEENKKSEAAREAYAECVARNG